MQWLWCESCASVVVLEGCFACLGIHVCPYVAATINWGPHPAERVAVAASKPRKRASPRERASLQAYNGCIVRTCLPTTTTPPPIYLRTLENKSTQADDSHRHLVPKDHIETSLIALASSGADILTHPNPAAALLLQRPLASRRSIALRKQLAVLCWVPMRAFKTCFDVLDP